MTSHRTREPTRPRVRGTNPPLSCASQHGSRTAQTSRKLTAFLLQALAAGERARIRNNEAAHRLHATPHARAGTTEHIRHGVVDAIAVISANVGQSRDEGRPGTGLAVGDRAVHARCVHALAGLTGTYGAPNCAPVMAIDGCKFKRLAVEQRPCTSQLGAGTAHPLTLCQGVGRLAICVNEGGGVRMECCGMRATIEGSAEPLPARATPALRGVGLREGDACASRIATMARACWARLDENLRAAARPCLAIAASAANQSDTGCYSSETHLRRLPTSSIPRLFVGSRGYRIPFTAALASQGVVAWLADDARKYQTKQRPRRHFCTVAIQPCAGGRPAPGSQACMHTPCHAGKRHTPPPIKPSIRRKSGR